MNGDSLRQDGRKVNELRSVCKLKLILKILTSILPSLWRIITYNASEWVFPMSQVASIIYLSSIMFLTLLLIVRYRSKKFVFYFNAFAFVFERKRKWNKMRGWSSLSCGSIIAIMVQWCVQQNVFTKTVTLSTIQCSVKGSRKMKICRFLDFHMFYWLSYFNCTINHLLPESSNCIVKWAFQSVWIIERTEWTLGGEARDNLSFSLSTGLRGKWLKWECNIFVVV